MWTTSRKGTPSVGAAAKVSTGIIDERQTLDTGGVNSYKSKIVREEK